MAKTKSLFNAFYVINQLSKIKDDIQFVSQFPSLLGHPVDYKWLGIKLPRTRDAIKIDPNFNRTCSIHNLLNLASFDKKNDQDMYFYLEIEEFSIKGTWEFK